MIRAGGEPCAPHHAGLRRGALHIAVTLGFAVASLAGPTPLWSQHPVDPALQSQRTAALAAYDAGRTAEAKAALERLAPRFPHDFAVQEALGLTLAEAGETAAALPHLATAAGLQPRNAQAQANLGAAYLALQQLPEAVAALRRAATLEPANAGVLTDLGHALFLHKEPGPAAEALGRASRLQPENGDLRYDFITALDASGQSPAALQALQQVPATERTPALESLWGDTAEHAGHFQEAVEHMKLAANRDPSEANLYALTVELLRHWTWQPAEEIAAFGLGRYPQSRRLRFAQGVAFYGDTQFAKAADVFAGLVAVDAADTSYGDLLGRSCAALGGAGSPSCNALVGLAEQHPENARLAVFAAISLLHRPENDADLGKAEVLLKQGIARDPKFPEAFYQLGVLQQQRQQWAESAESLRKAIALRPAYAEAHYRLSRACAHLGQKEAAAEELALQQRYAHEEKDRADAQLKTVTIFLTNGKP